jgi:hypothetical protein
VFVNKKSATVILTYITTLCTSAADIPPVKNIELQCMKGKDKGVPIKARTGPLGSRRQRSPEFLDNQHTNTANFSALPPIPLGYIPVGLLVSVRGSVNTRFMVRPESNGDLPACSAAPQPAPQPRAPCMKITLIIWISGTKFSY